MIDVIQQQFAPGMPLPTRLNLAREFLQILCLKIMSDKKHFDHVAFLGGTALRLLFGLRRFSEDLDFSITESKGFDFTKMHEELTKGFQLFGFSVETKTRSVSAVQSIMLKFPSLLKELGLSPMKDQKLSIKWDLDTNPPKGEQAVLTILNKIYHFPVRHYDLPSLFAGKLHACFFRDYLKGRDWYDFVWYISKGVKPNFLLLNNAIKQTEKTDLNLSDSNFKAFLLERINQFDFKDLKRDVERFLDREESFIFDRALIQSTIDRTY